MSRDAEYDSEADLAALNIFLAQSPLHQWLSCRIVARDRDRSSVDVELPDRPELHRGQGVEPVAHGGVVATLVDIAAHAALHAVRGHGVPTIDLRVDYMRLARLPLLARATVRRHGRTIGFVDVDILDPEGRLCASGRAVFLTQAGS